MIQVWKVLSRIGSLQIGWGLAAQVESSTVRKFQSLTGWGFERSKFEHRKFARRESSGVRGSKVWKLAKFEDLRRVESQS